MVRCNEFYEKWKRCGNFCEKAPLTAARIDAYLDQILEIEKRTTECIKNDPAFFPIGELEISEGALRPVIAITNEEVKEEVLQQIVNLAKEKVEENEPVRITATEVKEIVENVTIHVHEPGRTESPIQPVKMITPVEKIPHIIKIRVPELVPQIETGKISVVIANKVTKIHDPLTQKTIIEKLVSSDTDYEQTVAMFTPPGVHTPVFRIRVDEQKTESPSSFRARLITPEKKPHYVGRFTTKEEALTAAEQARFIAEMDYLMSPDHGQTDDVNGAVTFDTDRQKWIVKIWRYNAEEWTIIEFPTKTEAFKASIEELAEIEKKMHAASQEYSDKLHADDLAAPRKWFGSEFICECGASFILMDNIEHFPLACPGCGGHTGDNNQKKVEIIDARDDPRLMVCSI